jgi:type IV pilus assembly protein PilY1
MEQMKKVLAILLSASLLFISVPPISNVPRARADDSDIFGANIQPNVMILIDSSQSMSDSVTSIPYAPGTTYATVNRCGTARNQACTSTVVYRKSGSGSTATYTLYANSVNDVGSSTARTALSSVGFWSGRIGGTTYNLNMGNYLNYQFGVCAVSPCTEQKITVAKRVVENLIANTEEVRFGTMKFTTGGGQVISPIGTAVGTITTSGTLLYGVHNMTQTSVGTVLGEQIRDAGLYYKGQLAGYSSPIQYECQANFVIAISDGLYTGIDPRPQATTLYTTDASSTFAGLQNVIVHTIGFGIGASEPDNDIAANDILRQVAANGGGTFHKTDTSSQLEAALQDAIQQIVAATFSFATPVVPTTSTTGSTKAFLAAFQSNPSRPFWRGYLKAYQRGADGLVPVDANGIPLSSALLWDAGEQLSLKSPGDRTIKTVVSGSLTDFTTSNISASLLGVSTNADRDKVVGFIRGVDTYDEDVDGNATEDRAWKLGDIFHSTPVLVTPPFLTSSDSSYNTFKQNNASRTTVVIAGANDGMLHAFRESDGAELWAFIPPNVLGRLQDMTVPSNQHGFYVDGSPVAADVKIGSTWKTILIFGERRGGTSYYALDITDTTNPQYLWSFTDTKMGETWSTPAVGKVQMADGTTKFVGFVGGGYNTAQNNNSGKAVFAINLADGTKLWEYYNATGSSDDRQYMNFSLPGDASAVDLNNDGFIDKVYIGDVGGQLWKFDTSAAATLSSGLVNNWTGKRMFTAPLSGTNPPATGEYFPAQAIYSAPIPALDALGNVWVYFGTGDRNHPNSAATNRFYGIKDNTSMTNGSALTESSLSNVTSTDATITQGWYFTLASNEKVLAPADIFNSVVLFSTFTPTSVVACNTGGGTAKLYAVQMLTGYGAVDFGTGYALTSTSSSQTRSITIGTGIPSSPIMVITTTGTTVTTNVTSLTTSNQFPSNPGPAPSNMKRVLYWREVF